MVHQNPKLITHQQHLYRERTLLISVDAYGLPSLDANEFALLAQSANAEIVQHLHLQRAYIDAKFFIGSGKVAELADLVQMESIDLVIFDQSLSPSQERNLEKMLHCRVIDRTGLILDIFAQRARTYEGKLQVEFAQLKHLSTRLIRGFANLEQQKGGIGMRGPGETQLETDRRLIRVRIAQLKEKLDKVRQTRQQGRASRQKNAIPTISLVGYTNAGKSTLFNRLSQSDVYAADQLFATLDPTLRRIEWAGLGTVILADTVGFIQNLQHDLVDSFRATLEETLQADLLLHVIDASNPEYYQHIDTVEQVLQDIGVTQRILKVYNKIDLTGEPSKVIFNAEQQPEAVYLSAHREQGFAELTTALQYLLYGQPQHYHLRLDMQQHAPLYHQLKRLNSIQHEQYDEQARLLLDIFISHTQLIDLINQYHCDINQLLIK